MCAGKFLVACYRTENHVSFTADALAGEFCHKIDGNLLISFGRALSR